MLIYPEIWNFDDEPEAVLPSLAEVRQRIATLVNAAGTPLPMRAVARAVVDYYAGQGTHHPKAMEIVLAQVRVVQETWHPAPVEEL